MSDTRGFDFVSSLSNCEATSTNHTSYVGPGTFQWVVAGPQPPGSQVLYRAYIGDSQQWQVGSPPAGTDGRPVAYVWTSPYPGSTEICEAKTTGGQQGWYYMLYEYGAQPNSCTSIFWV